MVKVTCTAHSERKGNPSPISDICTLLVGKLLYGIAIFSGIGAILIVPSMAIAGEQGS